jgi:hypothetical protein
VETVELQPFPRKWTYSTSWFCGAPPGRNSGRLVEMRHAHDLAMPLGHLLVEANTFETGGDA